MRLFVAVEVPEDVRTAVAAIRRDEGPDVRWSDPSSWHVTLRFLGEVDDDGPARSALAAVDAAAATATVGTLLQRLGPVAVVLPVAGLDGLAAVVGAAFAGLPGVEGRRFTGHLTVGRLRRQGRWPEVRGGSLPAPIAWPVGSIALVRSHLRQGSPARYEVLARRPLGEPARGA